MRIAAVLAVFMLVAGIYCGGGSTGPQAAKPDSTAMLANQSLPAVALGALTEAEMGKFLKAIPPAGEAIKKANWQPEAPAEDEALSTALPKMIEGMKSVAGLEDALKGAGTNWDEFRATLYKVTAASAAIGIDMASAMTEELKKDTSAAAQKALKQLAAMKTACDKVPAENKQMVTKFQKELESLRLLGQ
jgi:hypothetical protein